jgi:hypothetical protein
MHLGVTILSPCKIHLALGVHLNTKYFISLWRKGLERLKIKENTYSLLKEEPMLQCEVPVSKTH